jgi:hypothetical protein
MHYAAMQHDRTTLSLRTISPDADSDQAGPSGLIRDAMAGGHCISAVYNGVGITLAPHILYVVRGDLFLDAVVVVRDGRPPKMVKLGVFKLAGLSEVASTSRPLAPRLPLDPTNPKYLGRMVAKIQ